MSTFRSIWANKEYEIFASKFAGKLMAAYTEAPIGDHHLLGGGYHHETNQLRGSTKPSSSIGLFKENTDIFFFWMDEQGNILVEAKSHLNNYGLHDNCDYSLEKQPGEFRIIVLGDELTAATTSSRSWPGILQEVLNSRNGGRNTRTVSVINLGHLDTGFPQWAYILEQRGLRFNPDLILVNIAPHDFQRTFPPISPSPNYLYLTVKASSGTTAITVFSHVEGLPGQGNSHQPSALLSFWTSLDSARNPSIMREYRQETIRLAFETRKNDILSGRAAFPFASFARSMVRFVTIPMKKIVRACWGDNIAYRMTGTSSRDGVEINQASTYLNRIASHGIPLLVLRNPWPQDFEPRQPQYDGLFKELARVNPEIKVINMKRFMPVGSGADAFDEINCCYSRYAKEKWTDHGHRVYADAVANCLESCLAKQPR